MLSEYSDMQIFFEFITYRLVRIWGSPWRLLQISDSFVAIASRETNIVNIVYIGSTWCAHIVICVLSHESCDTCIVLAESQIISDVSSWYEQSNFRAICCNKLL